jgi:hypothetical protein
MTKNLSVTRGGSAVYSVFVSNLEFMGMNLRSRIKIKLMKMNYDSHKTYY